VLVFELLVDATATYLGPSVFLSIGPLSEWGSFSVSLGPLSV